MTKQIRESKELKLLKKQVKLVQKHNQKLIDQIKNINEQKDDMLYHLRELAEYFKK